MADSSGANASFWLEKSLSELTAEEWESLCDGCGKCCLHKLQDEDTEELFFTSIACSKLDLEKCRCSVYETRLEHVPMCLDLSPDNIDEVEWLPNSCAYRLVGEGKALPSWHHLVSGSKRTVHEAQMSVKDRAISEADVDDDDWDVYIIDGLS
jgi:uncharacterized cysteine cluster protein YcgN (CxxCxxCC family)